jgi:hypothetical protein
VGSGVRVKVGIRVNDGGGNEDGDGVGGGIGDGIVAPRYATCANNHLSEQKFEQIFEFSKGKKILSILRE